MHFCRSTGTCRSASFRRSKWEDVCVYAGSLPHVRGTLTLQGTHRHTKTHTYTLTNTHKHTHIQHLSKICAKLFFKCYMFENITTLSLKSLLVLIEVLDQVLKHVMYCTGNNKKQMYKETETRYIYT